MSRTQFWILTSSIIFVGALFLSDIFLTRAVQDDERKVVLLGKIAQDGSVYSNRWEQLAVRIYRSSSQDAALKDLLVRQRINITPKTPAKAPESTPE